MCETTLLPLKGQFGSANGDLKEFSNWIPKQEGSRKGQSRGSYQDKLVEARIFLVHL